MPPLVLMQPLVLSCEHINKIERMALRTTAAFWKPILWVVVVAIAVVAFLQWRSAWLEERRMRADSGNALLNAQRAARKRGQAPPPPNARIHETARYRIITTADAAQTEQVAHAVERLHDAYLDFFRDQLPETATRSRANKLKLTLYRDRTQFQSYNNSMPWAEAYYRTPMSHAYYVKGAPNPYHWMVHEATHQLNAEVARFKKAPWIDEGLGTYFGSSRFVDGALRLGDTDPDTYPIWWLPTLPISGDLDADIAQQRWIPLHAFLTGKNAPPMGGRVNQYYMQYWSLTHFLFHYDNGRYASAYKQLIAEGGTLTNFEKRIGPADRLQREWYGYLLGLRDAAADAEEARRAKTERHSDIDTLVIVPEQ
jgi:Protein of unknown function (DUF1570)